MEESLKERMFRQSGQRQGQQKLFSLVMGTHSVRAVSDFTVFFGALMYQLPFGGTMSICWSHGWTVQRSVAQSQVTQRFLAMGMVSEKLGWNYQGVDCEEPEVS